ncbi:carboxypeptidase regulatory-like domain-containing protein [Phenylobacterium montanum]|uniref:Carboxypeptidase regulatory-like domain-containing protein n=1 Tax=Phenylobacterium montanum TaxID=2823693 RepID=A0A975G379_9CAUL|nr:carboxypeptidase regulatory-like domain-containing protein [Caulobacter sp. S6]QUD89682.1 carboxypeptidase regulatory-like domain-containing protein [Caulobacter sp. S6]
MTRHLRAGRIAASVAALAMAAQANAASFSGKIATPDGKPAYGAMVTVFNAAADRKETVYTGPDGGYAIRTDFDGDLKLRARLAGFDDAEAAKTAGKNDSTRVDLALKRFASDDDASMALSASAFNARLPWKDVKRDRPAFISQCNYCHQLGNLTTRVPRSHQEWMVELDKMEGLLAMPSTWQKKTFAEVLTQGFDGKPIKAIQDYGAGPELARAKVREWLVGDGYTFIHDADVARDQKLYGTDEGHDLLWVLDRATGKVDKYPLPDIDLPRGGKFSGMKLPIGVFSGKHGPHSMAQTSDGRIWITNALSSTLMSFDPATKAFKSYPVGHDALYPHTVRVDKNDIVWFTIVASNQLGRFDPKTDQMTVLRLPVSDPIQWISEQLFPTLMRIGSWFPNQAAQLNLSTHRFFGYSVLPFPYGIDIDPADGSVWYAKLYASKIGRIDPKTLKVTEWDTPMKGPRRPRFDPQGVLWIPSFDEGGLMRFDPKTQAFRSFKIPPIGEGEYETPYALNVDRRTGDIWMAANNSDRILRFTPSTQTFLSYPSPTRVTVLRDFSFAEDGEVCASSSNLPSYAIEDHRAAFVCVDPTGGEKDRQALAGAPYSKG